MMNNAKSMETDRNAMIERVTELERHVKPKKKGSVIRRMTSRVVVVPSFSMINSASSGVMLDGT